ncbi:MAG: hypothetical protein NC218_02455 [Acetobacter sp.]|nr:hypothetical protein [Acetobacter sp.]
MKNYSDKEILAQLFPANESVRSAPSLSKESLMALTSKLREDFIEPLMFGKLFDQVKKEWKDTEFNFPETGATRFPEDSKKVDAIFDDMTPLCHKFVRDLCDIIFNTHGDYFLKKQEDAGVIDKDEE